MMIDGDPGSPRAVFANSLSELFALAGNPPLKQVADRANALAKPTLARGAKAVVSLQRVHAWRTGANVPKVFEHLVFVVLALRAIAEKTGADPARCRRLTDIAEWRKRWAAALHWRPPVDDQNCPYLGLEAYGAGDARRFFGRDDVCAELGALIRASADSAEAGGMVILVGASGAGKSSLLHAGVVPALVADDEDTVVAAVTPGVDPLSALDAALVVPDAHWALGGRGVLVVDQLEELFTVCRDDGQRGIFIDRLATLATRRHDRWVAVVAAVRADFFARCLEFPALGEALNKRSYVLGPMRLAELREALSKPARTVGLNLESGLAEVVVTELCSLGEHHDRRTYDPGALPLMSHVMAATWRRREKRMLTVEGYREAGGVAGSIEATAEQAWAELTEIQQTEARRLLLDLVYLAPDGHGSRRRVPRAELLAGATDQDAARAVLERLTDARLLTADRDSVFLTHEIVLTAWVRLRGWVERDQVGRLLRQQIESDAAEWERTERDPGLLYRGRRLTSAAAASADATQRLSSTATEFVSRAQQARTRARRILGTIVGATAMLMVVVLVLGFTAYTNGRESAARHEKEMLASILAASESARRTDPTLSALLDAAAYHLNRDDENVRTRLLATQNLPLAAAKAAHSESVNQLHYAGARKLLVSAGEDGLVRLWNAADFMSPQEFGNGLDHGKPVRSLAMNSAGTLLATAAGETIRMWDTTDPSHPVKLGSLTADHTVGHVVMSSDGRFLAAAMEDGTVRVWNVTAPASVVPLGDAIRAGVAVRAIEFHPDSPWLAIATDDTVRLFSMPLAGNAPPAPGPVLALPARPARAIAFTPDGTTLAVGSGEDVEFSDGTNDASVTLWNVADPTRPSMTGAPFRVAPRAAIRALAFASDSTTLAVADTFQASVWNLAIRDHPLLLGEPLLAASTACGNSGTIRANCNNLATTVVFGPDDHTVVVGAAQGLIRLWSLAPAVIGGRHEWEFGPSISDNRRLVLAGINGTIRTWDIADRRTAHETADLGPGDRPPFATTASISSDGQLVAVPAEDPARLQLFDLSDSKHPKHLYDLPDGSSGGFTADRLVIVVSYVGPVWSARLWDVSDPVRPVARSAPIVLAGPDSEEVDQPKVGLASFSSNAKAGIMVTVTPETVSYKPNVPYVVRMWDLSDPVAPHVLDSRASDPAHPFTAATITSDGRNLITLSADTMQIWDISSREFRELTAPIATSGLNLISVDTSADGQWIATAGADSTVQLWDFRDRAHPHRFGQSISPGATAGYGLAFAPTGSDLIGVTNGTLRIWSLDEEEALGRICSTAGDELTNDIWKALLPDVPPALPCR